MRSGRDRSPSDGKQRVEEKARNSAPWDKHFQANPMQEHTCQGPRASSLLEGRCFAQLMRKKVQIPYHCL